MEVDVQAQQLLIPPNVYSLDTNVFIDLWSGKNDYFFSKHRVPQLWIHIEKLVSEGKIVASKEVYDELKREANPDLVQWAKDNVRIFSLSAEQISNAQDIINDVYDKYPGGYKPEVTNGADPFVVALAIEKGAVVFTQENPQHPYKLTDPNCPNNPSIPTVCDIYGVECVNVEKFIDREGFKVDLKK